MLYAYSYMYKRSVVHTQKHITLKYTLLLIKQHQAVLLGTLEEFKLLSRHQRPPHFYLSSTAVRQAG